MWLLTGSRATRPVSDTWHCGGPLCPCLRSLPGRGAGEEERWKRQAGAVLLQPPVCLSTRLTWRLCRTVLSPISGGACGEFELWPYGAPDHHWRDAGVAPS